MRSPGDKPEVKGLVVLKMCEATVDFCIAKKEGEEGLYFMNRFTIIRRGRRSPQACA